ESSSGTLEAIKDCREASVGIVDPSILKAERNCDSKLRMAASIHAFSFGSVSGLAIRRIVRLSSQIVPCSTLVRGGWNFMSIHANERFRFLKLGTVPFSDRMIGAVPFAFDSNKSFCMGFFFGHCGRPWTRKVMVITTGEGFEFRSAPEPLLFVIA